LASSAWAHTQLGPALADAALRLGDDSQIQSHIHLDLTRQSQHFEKVLKAQSLGKCVEFTYYSKNSNSVDERLIAPWRIFLSDGNSYLIGFDQLKGEQRIFKISRIVGEVSISTEDAIESAPDDLQPAQLIANWQAQLATLIDARLEIKHEQAGELRLLASSITPGEQFDLVEIMQIDQDNLVRIIAKNCDQVKVISPQYLRDEVQLLLAGVFS
jgi:predicted DNA-binding transcriptional regulator YafY